MSTELKKLIRVRLPPPITDPALRTTFMNVQELGFDIDTLWSSLVDRLASSSSDETWLYHMDEIKSGWEDESNDSDVLPEYRELCKQRLDNWDQFFESCREIYAHACMNYSMLYGHPIFQANIYHFEYDPCQGHLVAIKENEGAEDDELRTSQLPSHSYPYRDPSVPAYWC